MDEAGRVNLSLNSSHSLSLLISPDTDKDPPDTKTASLIKLSGRSCPPSPLHGRATTTTVTAGAPGVLHSATAVASRHAAAVASPPIPPRLNQQQHVSTTYISQDCHTLHVNPMSSPGGGGGGGGTGGGHDSATTARHTRAATCAVKADQPSRPPRARNDSLNPEIKINLADCRDSVNISMMTSEASSNSFLGPDLAYHTDAYQPT